MAADLAFVRSRHSQRPNSLDKRRLRRHAAQTLTALVCLCVAHPARGATAGAATGVSSDGSGAAIVGRSFDDSSMPLTAATRLSTTTAGDQRRPSIAVFPEGAFIVIWDSPEAEGEGLGVFGQLFAADGSPQGSELHINSYVTGSQRRADVSINDAGDFIVVWDSSQGQDGSGTGIFAQRFAQDGSRTGSEFQVNGYTTGAQEVPRVAWAAGGFVIVWESDVLDGTTTSVFGQRFDVASQPTGPEFRVSSYPQDGQRRAAISAQPDGAFIVVWDNAGQDGQGRGVFGRRYDSAGTAIANDFQINTFTSGAQRSAAMASDTSGRFFVAWQGGGMQDGSGTGVFGQLYAADGEKLGTELHINAFTTADQAEPAVTSLPSGAFVVVWQSFGEDGESYGIDARRYDANGVASANPFHVNEDGHGEQTLPAVAAGTDRTFIVWQSRSFCPGDCDDNRNVTVDELVRGVNLALERPVDTCPAIDSDGNQLVTVDELVRAVNATLAGCPA